MSLRRKLKVGVLIDSFVQPAWVYRMLEIIGGPDYAELGLVVLNDSPAPQRRGRVAKLIELRSNLLYIIYRNLEDLLFTCTPDASEDKDATGLLAGVPVVTVRPRRTKHSDFIEGGDLAKVKAHDIDVLIRLGFARQV